MFLKLQLFYQGHRNMPREMHHQYRGRDERRSGGGGYRGGNAPPDTGGLLGARPSEPAAPSSGYFLFLITRNELFFFHQYLSFIYSATLIVSFFFHFWQSCPSFAQFSTQALDKFSRKEFLLLA